MRLNKNLQNDINRLQNTDFKTEKEYSDALLALMRSCSDTLYDLSCATKGVTYLFKAKTSCRDFVLKAYFGGVWPKDKDSRILIEDATTTLLRALLKLPEQSQLPMMFKEDFEELTAELEKVSDTCELLESACVSFQAEILRDKREKVRGTAQ